MVRRGGPPLPSLRGQPGGEAFLERIEGSISGISSCGELFDLIEVFVQVLMPIPKPTGFTGADPYKM